jgi:thymidylate kinase
MKRGKFIVLYGVNRTGKSTQTEMLARTLSSFGLRTATVKYPIYNLNPSGELIQEYLRGNSQRLRNPEAFSPQEFQMIQVINRHHFQPKLEEMLSQGVNVISEDYTCTGIAWGMANRVPQELLIRMNSGLLKEDLAIYLQGKPFDTAKETEHAHEGSNELMGRALEAHARLAELYKWKKVDATKSIDDVADQIFRYVHKEFRRKPLKFYLGMPIASNDGSIQADGLVIVSTLNRYGRILDAHVSDRDAYVKETKNESKGINIYQRDMDWLMESDLAIFNITVPSTGIGREVERAVSSGTPSLVLCNSRLNNHPTRMVTHDKRLTFKAYNHRIQLENFVELFIRENPVYLP